MTWQLRTRSTWPGHAASRALTTSPSTACCAQGQLLPSSLCLRPATLGMLQRHPQIATLLCQMSPPAPYDTVGTAQQYSSTLAAVSWPLHSHAAALMQHPHPCCCMTIYQGGSKALSAWLALATSALAPPTAAPSQLCDALLSTVVEPKAIIKPNVLLHHSWCLFPGPLHADADCCKDRPAQVNCSHYEAVLRCCFSLLLSGCSVSMLRLIPLASIPEAKWMRS